MLFAPVFGVLELLEGFGGVEAASAEEAATFKESVLRAHEM